MGSRHGQKYFTNTPEEVAELKFHGDFKYAVVYIGIANVNKYHKNKSSYTIRKRDGELVEENIDEFSF